MFASPASRVTLGIIATSSVIDGQTPVNPSSTWSYGVTVYSANAVPPKGTVYWYFGGAYAGSSSVTAGADNSGWSYATNLHTWTATPGTYEVYVEFHGIDEFGYSAVSTNVDVVPA